jgi:hypothetical protein
MSSAIRNHRKVIERLCNLVSEVGSVRYRDELPHDCFCGENPRDIKFDFQCDEEIIAFIESAVRARLSNNRLHSDRFQRGQAAAIPLQASLLAEVSPATTSGR